MDPKTLTEDLPNAETLAEQQARARMLTEDLPQEDEGLPTKNRMLTEEQ